MNVNWSDYKINQLHRQEKMHEAEMHRLGLAAEGRFTKSSNRLATILASILSLVG